MKTLLLHSTLIAATTFSLGGCVTELDTTDVTGGTDPLADTSAKAAVEDGSGHQDTEMVGFHTGYGPARGHEDLVRFAVGLANDYIAQYGRADFYPSVPVGDSGPTTSNPLVKGNYETDFPSAKMRAFYNAPNADWHNDGELANLHSTRNHPGGVWESAYEACQGTKAIIAGATHEALRQAQAGNVSEALYWVGHATHTIQDSFSRAHSQRLSDWTLVDVCTYGERVAGACYHSTIDLRDRVWNDSWWCTFNPWDRSWGCLTEEARVASLATAGYLVMLERYVDGYITDLDAGLTAFFEGDSQYPQSGYFDCSAL